MTVMGDLGGDSEYTILSEPYVHDSLQSCFAVLSLCFPPELWLPVLPGGWKKGGLPTLLLGFLSSGLCMCCMFPLLILSEG